MEQSLDTHAARVDPEFWAGKRVFLTGHTGFKGSWLSIWLAEMGAEVFGFALAPERAEDMFAALNLPLMLDGALHHRVGDVRDIATIQAAMAEARPHIVFHMAAQPLVRRSYREPLETFATNVMGTVHLLEAARQTPAIEAVIIITTDKCYENREHDVPYMETDHLGGHDPYSSSKAAAEIVTAAYRRSFFAENGPAIASARAGNVIGGGDWNEDRLIPDAVRAWQAREQLVIRFPGATRPWQHVIDPLRGYLTLAQALSQHGHDYAEAWNFGPRQEAVQPVSRIIEGLAAAWGSQVGWRAETQADQPHEAQRLQLDCTKAAEQLGWEAEISLQTTLQLTADWYRISANSSASETLFTLTQAQIDAYGLGNG